MVSSLVDLASLEHSGRRWCIKIGHIPLKINDECVVQSNELLFHHGL
jgi:hypothetical protein